MQALKELLRSPPTCQDIPENGSCIPCDGPEGRNEEDYYGQEERDENDCTVQKEQFKPIHFLFSCIAMCVGLGNVWRFPFTAKENGGGAFLLPYLISLFLIGKPLYFLEVAIGQFSSRGQVKMWKLSPIFKGIGYMSAFAVSCITSYYCFVMAVALYYFFISFSPTLPWTLCDDTWTDVVCEYENGTVYEPFINKTHSLTVEKSIASVYFERNVLHKISNIDDGIGLPDWKLSLCLFAAWAVLFGILMKGANSIGRASYFTALFPYVVLFIMLGQGLFLEGAWSGVKYFLTPQWDKLLDWNVWYKAVVQCFFSLSVGAGCTIMLGSYNRFEHKLHRDATIITLVDTLTSLLAGCTIFAVLGNLALVLGKTIDEVKVEGMNLAFKAYPLILSKIGWAPQLFAVLFFLMLLTLGIGSSTSNVNCVITVIRDRRPDWRKEYIAAAVCLSGFLLGLVYTTPGGETILALVDTHAGGFLLFLASTLEIVVIAWVYGVKNICRDLEFMLKQEVSWYWRICWGVITPVALCILLVLQLATFEPVKNIPVSATVCGWILTAIAVLILPFCAAHVVMKRPEHSLLERIKGSLKPDASWGPNRWSDRKKWEALVHGDKELL